MAEKIPKVLANQFESQILERGKKIYQDGEFNHFDYVRNSYCAQFYDKRGEYWTLAKKKKNKDNFLYSCDCQTFMMHKMCPHNAALLYIIFSKSEQPKSIYDSFSQKHYTSLWLILAKEGHELYGTSKIDFSFRVNPTDDQIIIIGSNENKEDVFRFSLPKNFWSKIWSKYRFSIFENNNDQVGKFFSAVNTIPILDQELAQAEKTELEERMNMSGYKSWQQKFEESIWFDLSKIWFSSIDIQSLSIQYNNESLSLNIFSDSQNFFYKVPKGQMATVLDYLAADPILNTKIKVAKDKVELNYSLKITPAFDLKIIPVLILPQEEKPLFLTKRTKLDVALFGKYIHIQSRGFFPFERKNTYFDSSIFSLDEIIIPNEKIPSILVQYKKSIEGNNFHSVSPSLLHKNFIDKIDSANVIVSHINRNWYHLDVRYKMHNESISFYDIYASIKKGKRYLIGQELWIDLELPEFDWLHDICPDQIEKIAAHDVQLKIDKLTFFKMRSMLPAKNEIRYIGKHNKRMFENFLNLKPNEELPSLANRKYVLRDYQINGYGWLWFLYENNLAGLLCDDMGLGKTYQSLALLDAVTLEQDSAKFLVVCPTSVISHWRDKLSKFIKNVHLHVYHGSERELKHVSKQKYSIILTSYGVMRNDLEVLKKFKFDVLILDEIQSAKNKTSLTNAALSQLNGRMKIGLTGTPIENNLSELKALFDIVLPHYLGSDSSFKKKFVDPIEQKYDKLKMGLLHRVIYPFSLRRTKSQVLSELPPKTEEIRTCELSADQVKLYKDVIRTRAASLVQQLSNPNEVIPYIHIFAVLNYLKQICNHPSQLEKNNLDYKMYQSGKWELFCELLEESLNSGFKIVVFSQYLNMLALIEAYLKDLGVEFATIKGSTTNRGEMIDKFNNDPNCMVFTGSLKASGLGIDLIGGSVVIHYDRWWNAAREDQATDRVHRIGQTRGVQVFKLITEGTLEEKIDQIISKKKDLMENMVIQDDATAVKRFDRDELIDLLTYSPVL